MFSGSRVGIGGRNEAMHTGCGKDR